MRKILIFSTNYLPFLGGAEVAVKEITDRLSDIRFDLIAPLMKKSSAREEKIGNVYIHRVGFGSSFDKFLLPLFGFFKAVRLNREIGFEVSWSIMASQGSIAASFFKIYKSNIPLVLTLQEGDEEDHLLRYVLGNKFLYRIIIKPWHVLVFKKADFITTISNHLKNRALSYGVSVPVAVIPNGVDVGLFSKSVPVVVTESLRKSLGFSKDDIVIIHLGRLVEKNGVDTLIDAVSLLPKEYKLLLVGEGSLESVLKEKTKNLSLQDRVVFSGAVKYEETPKYYRLAQIFARPSLSEGFGNSFVEAMISGVPVIATPVGGITDFIKDKKTGIFCGVADARDLALKIGMIWRDRDLRGAIVQDAKRMVEENYGWDKIAKDVKDKVFMSVWGKSGIKIVITTGVYPPEIGGPAQYAKNLEIEMIKIGNKVKVLTYKVERKLPTGFRHLLFFLRSMAFLFSADCVLTLDTMSVGLPSVFAAKILGKKVIVRVGGDFLWEKYIERTGDKIALPSFYSKVRNFSFKERLILRLTKWILVNSSAIVFSTDWQKEIFERSYGLDSKKVFVIENFYGRKSKANYPTEKNFIWAARPIKLKNLELLREAFQLAKEVDTKIKLEELEMPYDELMNKISSCYAVILPSFSEASPNFILDALRFDKPFITTKYCGLFEKLRAVGLFVDPFDETDIKQKIVELSDEKNYKECLKKVRSFDFVHSWEQIANEFLEIIKTQ